MLTKMRPRYYCEHCKKAGGRKDVIQRHETGCTANPNRVCGCCRLAAQKQPSIAELKAAISKDAELADQREACRDPWDISDTIEMPTLLSLITPSGSALACPACVLTALRATDSSMQGFDFAKSMAAWMSEFGSVRERY